MAAAQDRALTVDDVRPLPPNNPSGEPNFFFIVVCTLGGFLTIAALGFAAPTLPEYHRLAVAAVASVLAPVIAYLIGGPGYDTFGGSFGTIVAMLGMGALYAFTVAVITRLMQLGLGLLGTLGPLLRRRRCGQRRARDACLGMRVGRHLGPSDLPAQQQAPAARGCSSCVTCRFAGALLQCSIMYVM